MKQMCVLMMIFAMLLTFQLIVGCEGQKPYALRQWESMTNDAIVVVKCQCVIETNANNNRILHFRATEIWRNESNGLFTNKIGDFIGFPLGISKDEQPPDGVVQFFRLDDIETCLPNFTAFVADGEICEMPVAQAKHIISTTSSFGGVPNNQKRLLGSRPDN